LQIVVNQKGVPKPQMGGGKELTKGVDMGHWYRVWWQLFDTIQKHIFEHMVGLDKGLFYIRPCKQRVYI